MRARLTLRAPGARKIAALTMASAAVVLGSAAAGALAAQSSAHPAATRSSAHPAAAHTRLVIHSGHFATPAGSMVVVHGLLEPGERGAEVKLETRAGRHWHTLAVGHTRRSGEELPSKRGAILPASPSANSVGAGRENLKRRPSVK